MGPTTYREYSASKASVLRGRVQIIGSEHRVFEVKRILKATNSNTKKIRQKVGVELEHEYEHEYEHALKSPPGHYIPRYVVS